MAGHPAPHGHLEFFAVSYNETLDPVLVVTAYFDNEVSD
jgi:hypothetical protein